MKKLNEFKEKEKMNDSTKFPDYKKSRRDVLYGSRRKEFPLHGNKNGIYGSDTEQIKGKAVFVK